MTTLLLAFGIMVLLMAGMAVGVLAGREPIKGSCGGLANIGLDGECEICGGDLSKCDTGAEDRKPGEGETSVGVQVYTGESKSGGNTT